MGNLVHEGTYIEHMHEAIIQFTEVFHFQKLLFSAKRKLA